MRTTTSDEIEERDRARTALEKMKKVESRIKFHVCKINDRLTVCCKRKSNIERYKKLKG